MVSSDENLHEWLMQFFFQKKDKKKNATNERIGILWRLCVVYCDEINHNRNTIHIQIQADSVVSDTNGFINFWLQFMATRRERQNSLKSLLTILWWLHPNARCILWSLRSLLVEIRKTQLHLSTVKIQLPPQWSHLNWLFFKILRTISSSTLQPHFLSEGLWWQMMIVISFARESKTAPNDNAPGLLTRIVQSPTKLNDKI